MGYNTLRQQVGLKIANSYLLITQSLSSNTFEVNHQTGKQKRAKEWTSEYYSNKQNMFKAYSIDKEDSNRWTMVFSGSVELTRDKWKKMRLNRFKKPLTIEQLVENNTFLNVKISGKGENNMVEHKKFKSTDDFLLWNALYFQNPLYNNDKYFSFFISGTYNGENLEWSGKMISKLVKKIHPPKTRIVKNNNIFAYVVNIDNGYALRRLKYGIRYTTTIENAKHFKTKNSAIKWGKKYHVQKCYIADNNFINKIALEYGEKVYQLAKLLKECNFSKINNFMQYVENADVIFEKLTKTKWESDNYFLYRFFDCEHKITIENFIKEF